MAKIAEAILPESRTWGALIDGPGGIGKTALAVRAGHLAPVGHYPLKIFLSAKIRDLKPEGETKLEDFMLPNFLVLLSELANELGNKDLAKVAENERVNSVRRELVGRQALIVIDNVETFAEPEQARLFEFLNRLPHGCKAIVTSRRRNETDARVIRLERLELKDALELLAELAKTNHLLAGAANDWQKLYEFTGGNPLLLRWIAGQLGRRGSNCRTVLDACDYLKNAPPENDPLEYVFGDLLGTFTDSEAAVLAALTHFDQPAQLSWITDLAGLAERQTETALEDLFDRSVLVSDAASRTFFLPPLTAAYLRSRRPEPVAKTGSRLVDKAYALALENGYQKHDNFPTLEAKWPFIAAALPRMIQGDNGRLQRFCGAIRTFLEFSGRWDEWIWLEQEGEQRGIAAAEFLSAGWRAYRLGWAYYLRGQSSDVLVCAARARAHWLAAGDGAREQAEAIRLEGAGHLLLNDFPAAIAAYRGALALHRTLSAESEDVAWVLNSLAEAELLSKDYDAAERDYRESLRIAKKLVLREAVATVIGNLALLALDREQWTDAEQLASEALGQAEAIGRQELIGLCLSWLAQAVAKQGRPAEGLPHAQRAVEIFEKLRKPDDLEYVHCVLKECQPDT